MFLLDGKETLTHEAAKLRFPAGVSVPTDPGYTIAYDGVFVPAVTNQIHVSKDKFNAFQLFGAIGLRSDLDLSDKWSVMLDGRANFALFDSRTKTYLDALKTPSGAADLRAHRVLRFIRTTERYFSFSNVRGIKNYYNKIQIQGASFKAASKSELFQISRRKGKPTKKK